MSERSIVLIVIGVILISIAVATVSAIPRQANIGLYGRWPKGVNLQTNESQDLYIQTVAHCKMLQNLYFGASGLICLFAGLMAPAKKTVAPAAVLQAPSIES